MNLREAAQRALEILEEIHPGNMTPLAEGAWNTAIIALRAALAEIAMQRLTDEQQEMEETHTSVDNEYTPVKSWAWNEYPIDTDTTRGTMLMTVGDTLSRAGFIKKQEPLSIETINKLWNDAVGWGDASSNEVTFVRAIERAHGIGG